MEVLRTLMANLAVHRRYAIKPRIATDLHVERQVLCKNRK